MIYKAHDLANKLLKLPNYMVAINEYENAHVNLEIHSTLSTQLNYLDSDEIEKFDEDDNEIKHNVICICHKSNKPDPIDDKFEELKHFIRGKETTYKQFPSGFLAGYCINLSFNDKYVERFIISTIKSNYIKVYFCGVVETRKNINVGLVIEEFKATTIEEFDNIVKHIENECN